MTVNLVVPHRVNYAINGDFILHQVGKSGCITKFEVGNLPCIQSKLLEAVIGKIAGTVFSFRIDVVNIIRMADFRSVISDNRCLAHAERTGKDPCRHGQGCENPAHLQLFGFGT